MNQPMFNRILVNEDTIKVELTPPFEAICAAAKQPSVLERALSNKEPSTVETVEGCNAAPVVRPKGLDAPPARPPRRGDLAARAAGRVRASGRRAS
ncbi:hypothetical protein [Schumannella luteola]